MAALVAAACAAPGPSPAGAAGEPAPLAVAVLGLITVENEHGDGFERSLFAEGLDVDGDGCDTRAEVLMRDSLVVVSVFGTCEVVAGSWLSRYDGQLVDQPALVEVDHLVPLDEAWDSGAWAWDPARRAALANDLDDRRTLAAVTAASNQAKGDADPTNWLPTDPSAVCAYLADWIAVKARWGLSMDPSEAGRLRNLLNDGCPGQTVEPWPPAAPLDPALVPSSPPTTAPAPLPLIDQSGACDASYPEVCIPPAPPDLDCGDITFRRFTVLPPDPHNFDGNADGVGCEGS